MREKEKLAVRSPFGGRRRPLAPALTRRPLAPVELADVPQIPPAAHERLLRGFDLPAELERECDAAIRQACAAMRRKLGFPQ
jgi:hypothetical protein